jgi:hypothetical protein
MSIGIIAGRRYTTRVQAPVSQDPQVDDTALQSVQGGMGLDNPVAGHLHRHIYAVFRRVPAKRTALQRSPAAEVQFRRPAGSGRFFW